MLRLEGVSVAYGKHEALHEVSLSVTAGETTAILGTNGAGKTTMLNAIVGLVRPRPGGRILFEGRPIESEPTHRIVESGVALVPEGRRLFGEMTVAENLALGAYARRSAASARETMARQLALLPVLAERRNQRADTLSGGEQPPTGGSRPRAGKRPRRPLGDTGGAPTRQGDPAGLSRALTAHRASGRTRRA